MLEIRDLSVETKDLKKNILQKVTVEVKKGTIIGLTGPSGCGKTTLLKNILGDFNSEYKITNGFIKIDGEKNFKLGSQIAYVPQNPILAFNPRRKIGNIIRESLCLHLKISKNEAENLYIKNLNRLNMNVTNEILNIYPYQASGGMLQRMILGLIISLKPKYILVDEPSSALDVENRNILMEVLGEIKKDIGILVSSHDIKILNELCDQIYIMQDGKIIEIGTFEELIQHPKSIWIKKISRMINKENNRSIVWKEYKFTG